MKKLVLVGMIVMMLMISGIVIATNGKTIEKKIVITSFEDKLIPGIIEELKSPDNKAKFVQDEIIVKFKGDVKPFRVIKVPEGKVGEKIKEYLERKDVEYAEPNYIAYALMVPNDPYYKYQWHLDNSVYGGIQMEEAWDISTGEGVTVAVVDTGIRKGTDLANTCFVSGYDFVNSDTDPTDDNGHGTHVAGTIAQSTNNNLGVAGVAFNSCLMPVKVLNSRGSGTYAQVANGIHYAADNGAKVISLSLGGSSDSATLKDAVAYAYEKGVTVVAACGNDNKLTCLYPAAYDDYVIAVGATQYDETKAPYSNYGPSLDLMAPGGNNNLDQNNDGYADGVLQQTFAISRGRITWGYYFFQGTSMATPHVSGVAALLIANENANTPDDVRAALQETAEDLGTSGRDDTYGWGLVDAAAALGWTAGPECTGGEIRSCGETDVGVCEYGTQICSAEGVWGECVGAIYPADEICDGLDNDCDGIVDQIIRQCGTDVGACEFGTQTCTNGIWGECVGEVGPTTEVCNGIDDDCDGILPSNEADVDADSYMICEGDCDDSNAAVNPGATEICDKIDNNCNGEIDEGGVCEAVKCWSGSNLYLYRAADQAKKFCKCAQGSYGYKSYKYSIGKKTVWKYVDPANNENWQVTSTSFNLPVYSVICTDGKAYTTNQDYYYPK